MKNNRRGMTLLEVLMVTVLLSFLAFTTFSAVRSTISVKEEIDQKTEMLQESRAAVAVLDRDIRAAFYMTGHDLGWNPITPANPNDPNTPPPPPIPTPITLFKGEPTYMFFSAKSHQRMSADIPEDEDHFVTYQLNKDDLVRAESSRAVVLSERDSSATAKYRQFVLLGQVKKLEFTYWDSKNEKWTDSWDTEKAETLDTLPAAVKIDIEYMPDVAASSRRKLQPVKISTAVRLTQAAFKTGSRNAAVVFLNAKNPQGGVPGQAGQQQQQGGQSGQQRQQGGTPGVVN